jgi:type IV fimbrial biogenesis protein FimT
MQANLAIMRPMSRKSFKNRMSGMTMTELLIVILIVAILTGIGVPSFLSVTNSNRISGEVNGLLGDLQYARSEAIKEGQPVTVCSSTDGLTCAASTNWKTGWIVFSDVNGSKTVDPGDAILRTQPTFSGTDTFVADNNLSSVTFNREGFGNTGTANVATITLRALVPNIVTTRCVTVTPVGMVTTLQGLAGVCGP